MGLGQYNTLGEYCGPHTASSVFLISYYGSEVYLCGTPEGDAPEVDPEERANPRVVTIHRVSVGERSGFRNQVQKSGLVNWQ